MIRSVLHLNPKNGDYDPLLEYFIANQVLERSAETPGFLATELLTPITGQGPALVTAAWEDEAAYQRWVDNPWRAQSNEAIGAVLDAQLQAGTKGAMYRLRLSAGRTPLA
jgi:heme-degrading monooxygenase HmoA